MAIPCTTAEISNVMFEWLALLLHIRKVPGSNLCSETGYPVSGCFDFFCPYIKVMEY
jgi:hypothetical protein